MNVSPIPRAAGPQQWLGRALSAIAVLFLLFDSVIKLLELPVVRESFVRLGFDPGISFTIGLLELACTLAYLVPRTAVLGAVLLTGIMGGAIASHLRLGDPLFTHVLFGVYLGAFFWGGLFLRDLRLRSLLPVRHG